MGEKEIKIQYNKYPYPLPIDDIDNEFIKKKKRYVFDPTYHWHRLWPELPFSNKELNVLVAGCGTNEAAILAKCNPHHKFTGIDLSQQSINHQRFLLDKHQIKNLFLLCEDFRNVNFTSKFDLIISTGVIHHLNDPSTALNFFSNNLEEEGVIALMIYGDKSSYVINELKKFFISLQLDHNQEFINFIKKLIFNLNPYHPISLFLKRYKLDLNHDSGIIDLFLNKNEKFFSILDFIKILSLNKLNIKNIIGPSIKSLTKYLLFDEVLLNKARMLNFEEQWYFSQILNWNDRKLDIVISKKKKKNHLFTKT